ncbi:MAG: hypothetical protein EHM89_19775 [Acidobacteria bacterium]|nr:MAG: hypothetical protein EHM89_19775 [Acidobacteriota bacterium]
MTKNVYVALLAVGACLLLSVPAVAHHGAASFDNEKVLTLKGTVTEWLWANPHCFLKVTAKDDTGTTRTWNLELGNPTDITGAGYRRTTFKPGDEVTVSVTPVKSGAPVGRLRSVELANGQKLPQ